MSKVVLRRVAAAIDKLRDDPRHAGTEKLTDRAGEYRVRVGDHRVVYTVDDKKQVVTVVAVRDRKDVYRGK